MKQTQKYKLNLIEPSDPFLPDALNANTQKVEDAMTAHEESIEGRLTVLESFHFVSGSYTGTSPIDKDLWQVIPLPFKPKAVITSVVSTASENLFGFATDQKKGDFLYLKLLDNGFNVNGYKLNREGLIYNFIAFG